MNYDWSQFHKGCVGRVVVRGDDGLHVCCVACGVSANMEAVSAKVSPADACKVGDVARTPIGKQSVNVDRGKVLE